LPVPLKRTHEDCSPSEKELIGKPVQGSLRIPKGIKFIPETS